MNISQDNTLEGIFKFQLNRRIIVLGKNFLNLLEKDRIYAESLEKLLSETGINLPPQSEINFKLGRKNVLDEANETARELLTLLEKFEFNLK